MEFRNVSIKGIVSTVPAKVEMNLEYSPLPLEERKKLSIAVGILERRVSTKKVHTSDLCVQSAQTLMKDLGWSPDSIDILIFVTQTPDHVIPATSHIIQHKLGLRKDILCFDVNEGCAGYVYGVALAGKLMDSSMKRCLLLVGDTVSKIINAEDHSNIFLFGDCGTATGLELDPKTNFTSNVDIYSDGSGKDAIIVEKGSIHSRGFDSTEGISSSSYLKLKGTDVFLFAIKEVPQCLEKFSKQYGKSLSTYDSICLHQANKMINDGIAKKLKLPSEKFLSSLEKFGNTSSASIPLSICSEQKRGTKDRELLLCGFGVGLSWAVGNFLFEGDKYSIQNFKEEHL